LPPFHEIFHWQFIVNAFSITIVDLILRGDNAVVIAAAARSLPASQRRRALIAGAGFAIVALVVAALFATRLLHVKFLQLIGGVAILWIAMGLFREEEQPESSVPEASGFWKAMWLIVVADVTMSLDNVLAIAAIAQGDVYLLLFGLCLSIPLVIVASAWISKLMDKYPVIVYIGAALLGRVAGQMMMTDAFVVQTLAPTTALKYSVEAVGVVLVLGVGFWLKRRNWRAHH